MRQPASRLVPDPVDRSGNRPDRLDALTRELRSAGSRGRTSAWLAERLGVSTRTVKRDVTALQRAGVPILASSGPQGGYVLDDSAPASSVSLTAEEVLAIVVGLQATPDQPFAGSAHDAVSKLLRALPDELRTTVADGAGRIWIRPGESGHAADHEVRAVLTRAAREHRVVLLDYEPTDEPATPGRQVEPLGFAQSRGRWFALAWCRDTDSGRWFGLDDITAAQATHETFDPRDVRDVFRTTTLDAPPRD
ncbi:HTH domain-containing protein [Haloactinopolyspora alba]|uniref:HTH domain-containing protein n=1 Tax=Haloactinopolyspora alba TaxID=648780 RepID=A0A2P8DK19_9ACTN|nr:WYL domain-containing protein [Haloactinopolyspora alba]PSK97572.1 HTH domain-containing protein [Haloactinopolyspora alba]